MSMTADEVRSLVREVVTEVLAENVQPHGERQKYTRFESSDGKSWLSVTLEKGEVVRKIVTLAALIIGATVALVQFTNHWFLLPTMDGRASALIAAHEVHVRAEMEKITPKFATKAEHDLLQVQVTQNDRDVSEIRRTLEIMQTDIKEILKRLR